MPPRKITRSIDNLSVVLPRARRVVFKAGLSRDRAAVLLALGFLEFLCGKSAGCSGKIISDARYTVFQVADVAVPRELFRRILVMIGELRPRPVARC